MITGGFGGIGIELANWLVCQGATSLVLTGRKKAPGHLRPVLNKMKAAGVHILEAPADVSRLDQVEELFDHIAQNLPPLHGIFHAAGVLEDGVLLQLDDNRFRAVCAPKIAGAWNLHSLTLKYPVDLFVMFSSAMALLGSPGQGNYAAANAFLDALAHHRRALGMPGLSVNWGPWSGIGLAAAQTNRGERLAQRGLAGVEPAIALEALGRLIAADRAQFAVMALDFPLMVRVQSKRRLVVVFR